MSTTPAPGPVQHEKPLASGNGYLYAAIGASLLLLGVASFTMLPAGGLAGLLPRGLALALGGFILRGLYMLQPNQAAILTMFGEYRGTDRSEGLRWANPLYVKQRISLRQRNLNAPTLKVNDKRGNPVEVSAVVVWRVIDTAKALFSVDDYERFVAIQSESALRNLASAYHYDLPDDHDTPSLRGNTELVGDKLREELHQRLAVAGVEVDEARISSLAYAPEIAAVMLRRQQAAAVIAARQKIVEGAVGMVEQALEQLEARRLLQADPAERARMVGNLLVVLCGEQSPQPVVGMG